MPQPRRRLHFLLVILFLAVLSAGLVFFLDRAPWVPERAAHPARLGLRIPVAVQDAPLPRLGIASVPEVHRDVEVFQKPYQFTEDWFNSNIDVWRQVLADLTGRPHLRYLEIGLFEGRSALWMAENVLTHETSRITGIDPFFDQDTKDRFLANLATLGAAEKFTVIQGFSQQELPKLEPRSFDIIYVDGSHTADDVLADAVMSFELLKADGLMIFDDYGWRPHLPSELRPMMAIDAFISAYRYRLEVVHRGYQVIVRKSSNQACQAKLHCSEIGGRYTYDWQLGELVEVATGEVVALSDVETWLLREILRSRRFGADGQTWVASDFDHLRDSAEFAPLVERLGLDL